MFHEQQFALKKVIGYAYFLSFPRVSLFRLLDVVLSDIFMRLPSVRICFFSIYRFHKPSDNAAFGIS